MWINVSRDLHGTGSNQPMCNVKSKRLSISKEDMMGIGEVEGIKSGWIEMNNEKGFYSYKDTRMVDRMGSHSHRGWVHGPLTYPSIFSCLSCTYRD